MGKVQHILMFIWVMLISAGLCYAQETAKSLPSKPPAPVFVPPAAEQPLQPVRRMGMAEVYFYEATEYRKEFKLVHTDSIIYAKKQGLLTLEQLTMSLGYRVPDQKVAEGGRLFLRFSLYRANAPNPMFMNSAEIKLAITADGQLVGEGTMVVNTPAKWSIRNVKETISTILEPPLFLQIASARHVVIQAGPLEINLGEHELMAFRDIQKAIEK